MLLLRQYIYIYIYIYYNPACMIAVYTFINVSKFIPLSYSFLDLLISCVTKLMRLGVGEENAPYNAAFHNAISAANSLRQALSLTIK